MDTPAKVWTLISAAVSSWLRTTPLLRSENVGASLTGVIVKLPEAIALAARPLSLTCHSIVRVVFVAVGFSLLLA